MHYRDATSLQPFSSVPSLSPNLWINWLYGGGKHPHLHAYYCSFPALGSTRSPYEEVWIFVHPSSIASAAQCETRLVHLFLRSLAAAYSLQADVFVPFLTVSSLLSLCQSPSVFFISRSILSISLYLLVAPSLRSIVDRPAFFA